MILLKLVPYDRAKAAEYAKIWAHKRNPDYLNFDGIGGDCTNFASQCLYAGCKVMNYAKDIGWYYNSAEDRAAAWSDAQYFHDFLVHNTQSGPMAVPVNEERMEIGDFILLWNGERFYHSLFVTGFDGSAPLVSAHTDDAYMRALHTYFYPSAQYLHITGINQY